MPTLYVQNVPKDRYQALRKRAERQRRSIAAEVLSLLEESVPTEKELRERRKLFKKLEKLRATPPLKPGPSSEEMIREDRDR